MDADFSQQPKAGTRVPYTLDWEEDYPGDPVAEEPVFSVLLNGAPSSDATVDGVQFTGGLVTFFVTSVCPVRGELYTVTHRATLASGIVDDWSVTFVFEE